MQPTQPPPAEPTAHRARPTGRPTGRPRRTDGPISPRETQVLDLIRLGRMPKEIAYELAITEHTVNHHLRHLRIRHGVTNNYSLMAQVLRAEIERLEDLLQREGVL